VVLPQQTAQQFATQPSYVQQFAQQQQPILVQPQPVVQPIAVQPQSVVQVQQSPAKQIAPIQFIQPIPTISPSSSGTGQCSFLSNIDYVTYIMNTFILK
jgi:hypothetical protein